MSSSQARLALNDLVNIKYEGDDEKCELLIEAIKGIKDDTCIKGIIQTYYNRSLLDQDYNLFDAIISISSEQSNIKNEPGINVFRIDISRDGYCGDNSIKKAAKDQKISSDRLKDLGIDRASGINGMRKMLCKIVFNLSEEDRVMYLDGLSLDEYISIKQTVDASSISAAESHLTDIEMELLSLHIGINLVFLRWDKGVNQWVARARIIDPNKMVTFIIANINKDGDQDHFDVGYLPAGKTWDHSQLKYGLNITAANTNSKFQETLGKEFKKSITNLFTITKVDIAASSTKLVKNDVVKKEPVDPRIKATISKARRGRPPGHEELLTDEQIISDIQQPSKHVQEAIARAKRVSVGFKSPRSLVQDLVTPPKEDVKYGTYADLNSILYGTVDNEFKQDQGDSSDNLNDTFDSAKKGNASFTPRKSPSKESKDNKNSIFGMGGDPDDSGNESSSSNSSKESSLHDCGARNNKHTKKRKDTSEIELLEKIIMKLLDRSDRQQGDSTTLVVGQTFDATKLKLLLKQEVGADMRIQPIALYQLAEALERFFRYREQETNKTHKNVPVSAIFSEGVIQATMSWFAGKLFHGKRFPGTVSEFYSEFPVSQDARCIEAVVRAHFPENPTFALKEFRKIKVWEAGEKDSILVGPLVDRFIKSVPINIRFLERFLKLVELIKKYDSEGTVLPLLFSEHRSTPSLIGTCWSIAHEEGLFSMKACFNGDQGHVQDYIKTFQTFRQYFNIIVEKLAALQDVFKLAFNQLRFEYILASSAAAYQDIRGRPDAEKNKVSFKQMTSVESLTDPDEEDNAYWGFQHQDELTHVFLLTQDNDFPDRRDSGGRALAKVDVRSKTVNSTKPCLKHMGGYGTCSEPCPGGYSHSTDLILDFLTRLHKKWSEIKASEIKSLTPASSKMSSFMNEVLESVGIDEETRTNIFLAFKEKFKDVDPADGEYGIPLRGRQGQLESNE